MTTTNNNDDTQADEDFFAALWNADGSSKHVASEEVAQEVQVELPDEIIVEDKEALGSVIEYKGSQWTVMHCEYLSDRDAADLADGWDAKMKPGWHSWLRKVV